MDKQFKKTAILAKRLPWGILNAFKGPLHSAKKLPSFVYIQKVYEIWSIFCFYDMF
jgi:hypothetical protein